MIELGQIVPRGMTISKSTIVDVDNMTATVIFTTAAPKKNIPSMLMKCVFDFSETGLKRILELAANTETITLQQAYRDAKITIEQIKDCKVAVKEQATRQPKDASSVVRTNLAKVSLDEKRRIYEELKLEMEAEQE